MRNELRRVRICLTLFSFAMSAASASLLAAQNPEMQQKVAEIKEAVAANKQALAQYTWVEQDTISLKGEQKKAGALPGAPWTRRQTAEDPT